MSLDTQTKKCDQCGLWLSVFSFYANKAKSDGRQNRCKECIAQYKLELKYGIAKKEPLLKRDFYFIPDIYLVGYGRTQVYQHSCLKCEDPFFCLTKIKNIEDLFCEKCDKKEILIKDLPEKNISNSNFIGNIVGWLSKIESADKKRVRNNYKKAYKRDSYTCQYCGYNMQNAKEFLPLHIDHIKPWSAHGGNALKNLVVSCQECNLIASDKWFTDFEEKKEFIIFEKLKKTAFKNRRERG